MNKKELENEIIKTQEQLKKLQAALKEAEEREKEVPETLDITEFDKYCYVTYSGDIRWTSYTHASSSDVGRVNNRRAFLSEEYAEAFAKKTQSIADMLHFKYLYDRDYEPNWDSDAEQKFCVYYDNKTKKFGWSYHHFVSYAGCVYFSSEKVVKKCVDWLNKKHN